MRDSVTVPVERLSERQKECLRLISCGYPSDKEIALKLGIAPETVKQHVASARKTLGVSSRTDAARILVAHETGDFQAPPPVGVTPPQPLVGDTNSRPIPISSRDWRRRLGPFGWLIPAYRGAPNDLGLGRRLMLLLLLPLAIIMVTVGALASFETLARLVRGTLN